MTKKIKCSNIFEKGHNNLGWEKIEKWIEDDSICAIDLMALVCAKFALLPQVKNNQVTEDKTKIILAGYMYETTIRKVI